MSYSKYKIIILTRPERYFLSSFYFEKIKYGIDTALEELDFKVITTDQDNSLLFSLPKNEFKTTGVINIAPDVHHPSVKFLEKNTDIKSILINCRSENLSWVDVNNVRGGKIITEHLINLGHKNILFINGFSENQNSIDRLEGFKHTLSKHKIKYDSKLLIYSDFSVTLTYERVKSFLGQKNRPEFSAIFAANDLMAVGAIRALKDDNIKVPEDVVVVGFDDFDFSATFHIPLTTYRQPFHNIGFLATKLLINQIDGKHPGIHQAELIGELIIRESCGSNPKYNI
ncbi:MAG: substrate-binding domain-containing protein [Endomicrobiales bacterium]|nr:substrate-binding domain-containing protein [Endomicrobiales bacterium]